MMAASHQSCDGPGFLARNFAIIIEIKILSDE
jgi:hypothetical protein